MKGRIIAGDGITSPIEREALCPTCEDTESTCVACREPEGRCDCAWDSPEFQRDLIDNYWGGDSCLELSVEVREEAFREEHRTRFKTCELCPER